MEEEGDTRSNDAPRGLGTFRGVFTPTLLTILGVIMYLRLAWVVGNGGLVGGLLVIGLAVGITAATGLALSSIATNTRLGAGGAYAIISRSLGLEVGGSVGVPLYISQALAVCMYIFGFRNGWNWIFPDHPPLVIDLVTFVVVFGIAYISADLAFKVQYVIMAVITLSLVLILASPAGWAGGHEVVLWGDWRGAKETGFSGTDFWMVFAVFFPAVTGIMAGATMSGELVNPRRSIPKGTLSAIAVSSVVYVLLAIWSARAGTAEELTGNYNFLMDKSLWGPGVVAGLLGATLSSALTSLVGAPRILVALTRDGVIPDAVGLSKLSTNGQPRRAMMASGAFVLGGLFLRDLNEVAPLLTMFFLIAYGVINVVVLIESSLRLQSYRPTLPLPRIVPFLGALGCVFAMFIVNPTVSLVAVAVVVALYGFILRRGLSGAGDSRSGMFSALAEWAAAKASEFEAINPRIWKPNLLVPVTDTAGLRGDFQLLHEIAAPEGSIKLLGITETKDVEDVTRRMRTLAQAFRKKHVFTTASVIDSAEVVAGIVTGLQALGSAFFRPNILFLDLRADSDEEEIQHLWRESRRLRTGLALLGRHPRAGMGRRSVIHLWIPGELARQTVDEAFKREGGMNLALLVGLRLQRAWGATLSCRLVVDSKEDLAAGRAWLLDLADRARLPADVQLEAVEGPLDDALAKAPQSDLDIFNLPPEPDLAWVRKTVALTRSACLYFGDSGKESAIA